MGKGFYFFLAFSLGVLGGVYFLPWGHLLWLGLVAGVCFAGLLAGKKRRSAYLCIGLALGLLWTACYATLAYRPALALDGRRTSITLRVADYPQETVAGGKVVGHLTGVSLLPTQVLLYGDADVMGLALGDTVTLTADCSVADQLRGESVRYYTAKGIFLTAKAAGSLSVKRESSTPLWALPTQLAKALEGGIVRHLPGDIAPLVVAILTGNRDGLSQSDGVAFSRTGTSHMIAVSGMHISFLLGALTLLLGQNPRRRCAIGLPLILLFVLMVGATPSVVRASIMQIVLLVAPLVRRESHTPTSLLLALFLILLANPYAVASIGLQLSFAAVVGIHLFGIPLNHWLREKLLPGGSHWALGLARGGLTILISLFSTTVAATALTLPLGAYYFQTISLVGPLANILVLPVISLLFLGGLLLALAALVLPLLATGLGWLLVLPARYVLWVVRGLSGLPLAAITLTSGYYIGGVIALYAVVILAVWRRGDGSRPVVICGCCGAILMGSVAFTTLESRQAPLVATVLNVGQGASLLLRSGTATALVDCGGNNWDSAGDIGANYLQDRGQSTLDLLVFTHFHDDHTNGAEALFDRLTIKALAIPNTDEGAENRDKILALAAAEGATVTYITENATLPLGGATLTLYAPLGDGGANEEGLTVLCTAGDFDLLYTGDMNDTVEGRLVKYGNLPDCEVLLAGHHGSRYATSTLLLAATRPETCIVSVGVNTYGHPTAEMLARAEDYGAALYRTDAMGHITITWNGQP